MNAVNTEVYEQFTTELRPDTVKMRTKNLDFFYGKGQALHSVSLPIIDKGVTALIGPSGCGKSTLLRTMNRIYALYPGQRAAGEIMLDGENILDRKVDVATLRSRVGMVFQKPTPFPMSIYDNVAFGVRLYENLSRVEMDERVEHSLRAAALWEEVKDKLKNSGLGLSGGQQQRLCVARGIAVKPEILLLDEPASALDPLSTAKLEETIVAAQEGLYDRHRHPQSAAGHSGVGQHRFHVPGPADRVRPHDRGVRLAAGQADRRTSLAVGSAKPEGF